MPAKLVEHLPVFDRRRTRIPAADWSGTARLLGGLLCRHPESRAFALASSEPFLRHAHDHVFVCFVPEHLPDPGGVLAELCRVLRPGGTLTVVEGDHGSTLFHPNDAAARTAVQCQVALQRAAGGDADIGRPLGPLLVGTGLQSVDVSPRLVYVDASRPAMVEGFIRNTFTAMVAGVRHDAMRAGLSTAALFDAGIQALLRTTELDGVFCYIFFKATGVWGSCSVGHRTSPATVRLRSGLHGTEQARNCSKAPTFPAPDGPPARMGARGRERRRDPDSGVYRL